MVYTFNNSLKIISSYLELNKSLPEMCIKSPRVSLLLKMNRQEISLQQRSWCQVSQIQLWKWCNFSVLVRVCVLVFSQVLSKSINTLKYWKPGSLQICEKNICIILCLVYRWRTCNRKEVWSNEANLNSVPFKL